MSATDILGNFSPRSIPERFSIFFLQEENLLPDEGGEWGRRRGLLLDNFQGFHVKSQGFLSGVMGNAVKSIAITGKSKSPSRFS